MAVGNKGAGGKNSTDTRKDYNKTGGNSGNAGGNKGSANRGSQGGGGGKLADGGKGTGLRGNAPGKGSRQENSDIEKQGLIQPGATKRGADQQSQGGGNHEGGR